MTNRIIPAGALLLAVMPAAFGQHNPKRPNVVFILVDDMGFSGIRCYSPDALPSPNIDALADEGIVCTNFRCTPLSSPTRVSIMTGCYPQRAGINDIYSESQAMDGLDPDLYRTFGNNLQAAGYRTGLMGKWHMGQDIKFNPLDNGWDVWHGYTMGNIDYISHINTQRRVDWWDGKELKDEPGYVTHLINRYSVEFIRESVAARKPFFLFVSHDAVHCPMQGPNDPPIRTATMHKYRDDVQLSDAEYHRIYEEMVAAVDEGVGEILETLEELKVLDNTLIIFVSDNGGDDQSVRRYPAHNGYLHGTKRTVYEGGLRVPAIFYCPRLWGHRYSMEPYNSMDFMPTFLEFCGVKIPGGLDGTSMLRSLRDGDPMPERKFFSSVAGDMCLIDGKWKLVMDKKGNTALYYLFTDRNEEHDLSEVYPERAAALKADIENWWTETTRGTRLEGHTSAECDRNTSWRLK